MSAPATEAGARRDAHAASAAAGERAAERLARARLGVALAAVALAAVQVRSGAPAAPWLALPAAVFVALVVWHARVRTGAARARRAEAWWAAAGARMDGTWPTTAPRDGARFRDPSHPYAEDLDLFGPGSLFARLSTARTAAGEARLAGWLLAPASPAEVAARRAAVADLAERLELR